MDSPIHPHSCFLLLPCDPLEEGTQTLAGQGTHFKGDQLLWHLFLQGIVAHDSQQLIHTPAHGPISLVEHDGNLEARREAM